MSFHPFIKNWTSEWKIGLKKKLLDAVLGFFNNHSYFKIAAFLANFQKFHYFYKD